MGTLAAVLAKKGIRTHKELFQAEVIGDIEDVNGILKITKIEVNYTLKAPEDKKPEALAALETYLAQCPGAQSVVGCIELRHQLSFME